MLVCGYWLLLSRPWKLQGSGGSGLGTDADVNLPRPRADFFLSTPSYLSSHSGEL